MLLPLSLGEMLFSASHGPLGKINCLLSSPVLQGKDAFWILINYRINYP
jgi:hypothetical protein